MSLLHNDLVLTRKTTLADKHLSMKDRLKLMRAGACDPMANTSFLGNGIQDSLNKGEFILWPVSISPHGKWGAIFHRHLTRKRRGNRYRFPLSCPEAEKMYCHSMSHLSPTGIIPLATATWRKEKSKQQYFHGHSYTCPSLKEYEFQGIGLAISNPVAIHIRGVREGKLVEPSMEDHEELENYERLMATDTDEDLITPHEVRQLIQH